MAKIVASLNCIAHGFLPRDPIVENGNCATLRPILSDQPIHPLESGLLKARVTELRGDWKFFKDTRLQQTFVRNIPRCRPYNLPITHHHFCSTSSELLCAFSSGPYLLLGTHARNGWVRELAGPVDLCVTTVVNQDGYMQVPSAIPNEARRNMDNFRDACLRNNDPSNLVALCSCNPKPYFETLSPSY